MDCQLRVSNLPRGTADWELWELMAKVGATHWHVSRVEGRVHVRKRFTMVEFANKEQSERAL